MNSASAGTPVSPTGTLSETRKRALLPPPSPFYAASFEKVRRQERDALGRRVLRRPARDAAQAAIRNAVKGRGPASCDAGACPSTCARGYAHWHVTPIISVLGGSERCLAWRHGPFPPAGTTAAVPARRSAGRELGLLEVHLDRRHLVDAEQAERVEVALHRVAALERDLLRERLRDAVQHGALHLRLRAARVDHLAADVAHGPHLVDLERAVLRHCRLHDLGKWPRCEKWNATPMPVPW